MVTFFVLVAVSGTSAIGKYKAVNEKRESVVVVEEVAVYGNPSEDSTLQFKIHEGTKVTTVGRRHGWMQICLPGDLFGWVKLTRSLISWSNVIKQKRTHDQLVNAVHGALLTYDLENLARALGGKLAIEQPVDAWGNQVKL